MGAYAILHEAQLHTIAGWYLIAFGIVIVLVVIGLLIRWFS